MKRVIKKTYTQEELDEMRDVFIERAVCLNVVVWAVMLIVQYH